MKPAELEKLPLQRHFIEFYNEIMLQKKKAAAYASVPLAAHPADTAAEPGGAADMHPIGTTLLNVLEKQVLQTRSLSGEFGVSYYRQAQYVMAALADEIFLNMQWSGREQWNANLLEFKLFKTSAAGEQFFTRLEKILKDRDVGDKELASIYFLALAMGFKGKFRDTNEQGRLDYYRRQLYSFVFQKEPDLETQPYWFDQAYAATLVEGAGGKMPYLRWWIGALVMMVLAFLAVSHAVWMHTTEDLVILLEKIHWGI
jgi:type VI secretion system protein ImpK